MYSVLSGSKAPALNASFEGIVEAWKTLGIPGKGAVIGLAAMAAFITGMLGSRKTGGELRDIYSGNDPVPVRGGRWWELGSTPFEGGRIKAWRPHWSVLHKAHSEEASLYGSEKEKWAHNPILHPLKWLKDPYYLEKLHYEDRPYPVASPALTRSLRPAAHKTLARTRRQPRAIPTHLPSSHAQLKFQPAFQLTCPAHVAHMPVALHVAILRRTKHLCTRRLRICARASRTNPVFPIAQILTSGSMSLPLAAHQPEPLPLSAATMI